MYNQRTNIVYIWFQSSEFGRRTFFRHFFRHYKQNSYFDEKVNPLQVFGSVAEKDCFTPNYEEWTRWSSTYQMLQRYFRLFSVVRGIYTDYRKKLNTMNR